MHPIIHTHSNVEFLLPLPTKGTIVDLFFPFKSCQPLTSTTLVNFPARLEDIFYIFWLNCDYIALLP